ncbi:MAG: tripartite tricarboxylate transporter TctB family protein [Alphaproteobacteria bacterium]
MIFGRPASDYFFIAFLWICAVAYTAIAFTYSAEARAVPLLVGLPLIVLSTVDLLSMTGTKIGTWMRRLNPAGARNAEADVEPARKHAAALGLVLGFLVLFVLIGAVPATAIYVAASMRLRGDFSLARSVLTGLIVAAACYGVFEVLLSTDLYKGVFFAPER